MASLYLINHNAINMVIYLWCTYCTSGQVSLLGGSDTVVKKKIKADFSK